MILSVVGQGWVGGNLSKELEKRGYEVIRYSLEEPYINNKDLVQTADYTFLCLPTPTTSEGFFDSIVRSVIPLCGKVVVIKSTMMPGSTDILQEAFPLKKIMFSPEFLREKFAEEDVSRPERNIIGITNPEHAETAKEIMKILPKAKYEKITTAKNAEMVKYAGNAFLTEKVLFANRIYDICQSKDIDYSQVREMLGFDSRIGGSHLNVLENGRGAGGDCFVKDYEGLTQLYEKTGNSAGYYIFQSNKRYNISLLSGTGKDMHILSTVYPKIIPSEKPDEQPELSIKSNQRSARKGNTRKVKDKKRNTR